MIQVDISNVWGALSLSDLLGIEKEVFDAHVRLTDGNGKSREWMDFPAREDGEEIVRILKTAETIRTDSEACVVIGSDTSCLGARAAIELLQGPGRNLNRGKEDPRIFFAGNNLRTRSWNELTDLLEDKDFSVIVIESGAAVEPVIAFRGLRWMLERKYGTDEANRRIYAVIGSEEGELRQMAKEGNWETFAIPSGVSGRFGVLSAAGLLPMAVAGINVTEVLAGTVDAKEEYDLRSFENPVWLYAGVRNALYRKGKTVEIFASFEPGFRMFGLWWQQLFGAADGKGGQGIFPSTAELPAELSILGRRNLFETMVRFDAPEKSYIIGSDWKNLDDINYLEGKTLDFVETMTFESMIAAHEEHGIPVVVLDCGELNDRKVGKLFCFLELASGISAFLGSDIFEQSGVEGYRSNLFRLLGKAGCDE